MSSAQRPHKQSMSELKLRRLIEHNQRLREDLARPRINVSEASASLINYCKTTKDYLVRCRAPADERVLTELAADPVCLGRCRQGRRPLGRKEPGRVSVYDYVIAHTLREIRRGGVLIRKKDHEEDWKERRMDGGIC